MKIPNRIRYFNKRFLNRLTSKIARLSWGPFSIVYHVGRHSGKLYETPIFVFRTEDGFLVALTYGTQVDWYRNVSTRGCCKIEWHGPVYPINKLEQVDPEAALPYFPGFERTILRLVGIKDFIKMVEQGA